eukprot:gene12830-biopygen10347
MCPAGAPLPFQGMAAKLAAAMALAAKLALAAQPGGINGAGGTIWRQSWRHWRHRWRWRHQWRWRHRSGGEVAAKSNGAGGGEAPAAKEREEKEAQDDKVEIAKLRAENERLRAEAHLQQQNSERPTREKRVRATVLGPSSISISVVGRGAEMRFRRRRVVYTYKGARIPSRSVLQFAAAGEAAGGAERQPARFRPRQAQLRARARAGARARRARARRGAASAIADALVTAEAVAARSKTFSAPPIDNDLAKPNCANCSVQ